MVTSISHDIIFRISVIFNRTITKETNFNAHVNGLLNQRKKSMLNLTFNLMVQIIKYFTQSDTNIGFYITLLQTINQLKIDTHEAQSTHQKRKKK